MLRVRCSYFIFFFNGKFTLPLLCMNKLCDLEAYVEFTQSPVYKCTGSEVYVDIIHPQSNVKHLSARAGGASDSQCQLPLSVAFPSRLDGSHVSFCAPSQFRFSQPVSLHVTFLCLPVSLTVFNVFLNKKPFYLLQLSHFPQVVSG